MLHSHHTAFFLGRLWFCQSGNCILFAWTCPWVTLWSVGQCRERLRIWFSFLAVYILYILISCLETLPGIFFVPIAWRKWLCLVYYIKCLNCFWFRNLFIKWKWHNKWWTLWPYHLEYWCWISRSVASRTIEGENHICTRWLYWV